MSLVEIMVQCVLPIQMSLELGLVDDVHAGLFLEFAKGSVTACCPLVGC
jgi:hypothetical protein